MLPDTVSVWYLFVGLSWRSTEEELAADDKVAFEYRLVVPKLDCAVMFNWSNLVLVEVLRVSSASVCVARLPRDVLDVLVRVFNSSSLV